MVTDDFATALYLRHRLRVWRYLRHATGSADTADDLSQEVFLRVFRGADRYDPRGLDSAWIFAIVRTVVAEHHRTTPPPGVPVDTEPAADPGVIPLQLVWLSLTEALDRLAPTDRDLILLRESGGLTHRELATTLHLSVATVKRRLSSARRWLRRRILRPPAVWRRTRTQGDEDETRMP